MHRFKEAIIQEIEVSESIMKQGNEVTLRFRILSNNGDYTIHTPLTGDYTEHMNMLCIVKYFMLWKNANAFVMSSRLIKPNAISSAGLTKNISLAAYERITTRPLEFGMVQWLEDSAIDPIFDNILPQPTDRLGEVQKQECYRLFGAEGQFKVDRILH